MTEGSDSGKAREFWLYDNGEEPFLAYYGLDDLKADTSARPDRIIHVIEKSAYDRLAQELAAVKKELAEVREEKELFLKDYIERCRLYVELEKELAAVKERLSQKVHLESVCLASAYEEQLDEARAEIERLKSMDLTAAVLAKDIKTIANRDQTIAIYEKALKFYANQDYYDGGRFTVDQNTAIDALTEAGKVGK